MNFRSKWTILSVLGLTLVFFQILHGRGAFPQLDVDADRYYHLAISRQAAHDGIVRSIPQAEDIHWDKNFADKEFLFHILSGLAYKLGGDQGVMALVPVLGLAIVLSLFFILYSFLPLRVAVISNLLLITNGYFATRVSLLRPSLLSTLITLWLVYALLKKKRRLLFITSALFTLSYHALFVPFLAIVAFVAATFRKEKNDLSLGLWGLGGIVCGVLVNPYFPANLSLTLQHIQVATGWGISNVYLNIGDEIRALNTKEWAHYFLGPTLVAFFAIAQIAYRKGQERTLIFFFLISSIFLCFTLMTPRAGEYLVPFSAFLLGFALLGLQEKPLQFWGFTLLVIMGQSLAPIVMDESEITHQNRFISSTLAALEHIPASASGKKVFHDNWSLGPLVYYARPDLRFVDLLDPTFLFLADPKKVTLKDMLRTGRIPDAYSLLKSHFDASYVLTRNPVIIQQLDIDPNFKRIYPPQSDGGTTLYALREQRVPNQILEIAATVIQDKAVPPTAKDLNWIPLGTRTEDRIPTAMLDLRGWYVDNSMSQMGPPAGDELCVAVKPTAEIINAHLGAEYLGLGGEQRIQLWWNKRLLYSAQNSFGEAARLTDVLIPLPHPLKQQDQIFVTVCANRGAKSYAVSLSLWRGQELDHSGCSRKLDQITQTSEFTRDPWQYCVAPLAYPMRKDSMKTPGVASLENL